MYNGKRGHTVSERKKSRSPLHAESRQVWAQCNTKQRGREEGPNSVGPHLLPAAYINKGHRRRKLALFLPACSDPQCKFIPSLALDTWLG